MTKQDFLNEIKSVVGIKEKIVEELKTTNQPVVIFGTGNYAKYMSKAFASVGIPISGYAVDEKYYKPNQKFLGLPILNFDAIVDEEPEKYIFLLGLQACQRVYDFVEDSRIKKYVIFHDIGLKACEVNYDFILQNQDKFFETYELLSDDLSKNTMIAYLKGHITFNPLYQKDFYVNEKSYFNSLVKPVLEKKSGGYVDCGAGPYYGDMISQYIEFVDGNYEKIFAFEPCVNPFNELKKIVEEKGYKNVELFNCGVSDKNGTMIFQTDKITDAVFSWSTDIIRDENMVKNFRGEDISLPVRTIDDTVGDFPIHFIKMDIEGSELAALNGAKKTLKNSQPALAICAYHKKEDLITLPQFLKNFYPNAKFYLRKEIEACTLFDLVLYVIPD